MSNYFVVATAKFPVKIKDKYYKIGESIPTELTESEYNFVKDALDIEIIETLATSSSSKDIIESAELSTIDLKLMLEEANRKIKELESKSDKPIKPIPEFTEVKTPKTIINPQSITRPDTGKARGRKPQIKQ